MSEELVYLLANPNHLKKKEIKSDIYEKELFTILNKLYPQYNHKFDTTILEKIEYLCKESYIDYTVNNIVNTIITEILNE